MSNMKFSAPPRRIKQRAVVIASAVCLVAVGAAAWVGTGKPKITHTDTLQNNSVSKPPAPVNEYDDGAFDYTVSEEPSVPVVSKEEKAIETVTPTAGFFVEPLTGELIKDFSDTELQYSMTYNDWRLHNGIDIKGVTGDAVHAAGDGTVTAIYTDREYGLTVEINHGNDITAIYSGFETVTVKVGDVVIVNMDIGTLGKIPCESVETTHLHFSAKKGDTFISPLNIIGV